MFLSLTISGLALGSVYSLIALGYSMIYKSSGLMSFVQGDIMTLGAFIGLTFYKLLKLPFGVSLVLTLAIAFGFGMLLEWGVVRRLLSKGASAIYIILATIAISYIMQNGEQFAWGPVALQYPSVFSFSTVKIFGTPIKPEMLICLGVTFVMMILLHLFMTQTRFGTAMRAASMDRMAALSCGVNVPLSTGVSWGISSSMAAIAGMLLGPMYGVYVTLGATIGRKGFGGAVVGGYGNMYGAMIGGLSMGVLETLIAGYISSALKNLFTYIVLILFLFLRPTGILDEKAIQDI